MKQIILAEIKKIITERAKWTKELVQKEAEKYGNRGEFQKKSPNAYSAALLRINEIERRLETPISNETIGREPTKEMFEASVDGQPFDMERWGQYYRPAGSAAPAGAADTEEFAPAPVAKPTPAKAAALEEDDPVEVAEAIAAAPVKAAASSNKAEDILAMIRARQKTA